MVHVAKRSSGRCPTHPGPVSPTVAVRLGKLFGDGAGVWVRMQAAYDTWNAERNEDVSKIPTLGANAA
jgi:antitoxin HigA-1